MALPNPQTNTEEVLSYSIDELLIIYKRLVLQRFFKNCQVIAIPRIAKFCDFS